MNNALNTLKNAYIQTAVNNYPYNATVYKPMPANPVNVSCSYFSELYTSQAEGKRLLGYTTRLDDIVHAMKSAANVYLANDTGKCLDFNEIERDEFFNEGY
jgi:hypothetical protein